MISKFWELICLQASLIPVTEDIARFELSGEISWILIVEKEVWTLKSRRRYCSLIYGV